jgi:hypothetical protein
MILVIDEWVLTDLNLNPLHFFLWGYIQDNVYLTPLRSSPEKDSCESVKKYPKIFVNATRGVSRRCRQCLEQHGANFEPLE